MRAAQSSSIISTAEAHSAYQSLQEIQLRAPRPQNGEQGDLHPIYQAAKDVYCFLGLPGSGKSTQITLLKERTGAAVFHMGSFARGIEGLSEEHDTARRRGALLSGLDKLFLDSALTQDGRAVILDGFPRSVEQADLLAERVAQQGLNLRVVWLGFEGSIENERSMERQIQRAIASGKAVDIERFQEKLSRALTYDKQASERLRENGFSVNIIDADKPTHQVFGEVRNCLGLNFGTLQFERQTLEYLDHALTATGIKAYLCAGGVYRPFFNNNYGPAQESTDKDIFVLTPEEVVPLYEALQQEAPFIRWAVHSRQAESQKHYGIVPQSLEEGILQSPYVYRQAGATVVDGSVHYLIPADVERDLRVGVLRLDERFLRSCQPEIRERILREAPSRLAKTLQEYPGLKLEGIAAQLYEGTYGKYNPQKVLGSWRDIETEVLTVEGKLNRSRSYKLEGNELVLAQRVATHYRDTPRLQSPPPRPHKGILPRSLQELSDLKVREDIYQDLSQAEKARLQLNQALVPQGYSSWLHYMVEQAPDASFKEWLLNQTRSRCPFGGKDPYLDSLRTYRLFEGLPSDRKEPCIMTGEQKATHQGRRLVLHLIESTLQLDTDDLFQQTALNRSLAEAFTIRASLRLGMLHHDIGKLVDINTPGAHEAIGAAMWRHLRPPWVSNEVLDLSTWIIRNHDLYGRLARSITEKEGASIWDENFSPTLPSSYAGALSIEKARQDVTAGPSDYHLGCTLLEVAWKADVGSVASLRWLLPVAEDLHELLVVEGHTYQRELTS